MFSFLQHWSLLLSVVFVFYDVQRTLFAERLQSRYFFFLWKAKIIIGFSRLTFSDVLGPSNRKHLSTMWRFPPSTFPPRLPINRRRFDENSRLLLSECRRSESERLQETDRSDMQRPLDTLQQVATPEHGQLFADQWSVVEGVEWWLSTIDTYKCELVWCDHGEWGGGVGEGVSQVEDVY